MTNPETTPHQPTPEEMRRALEYIARYDNWDFSTVRDPWKWCNEFIDVAKRCLAGDNVFL